MEFYWILSRRQVEDGILIFHKVANKFQAAAADQKMPSQLMRDFFDSSFASEDIKSEQGKEKAKTQKKKKKTDKELTEDVNFSAE